MTELNEHVVMIDKNLLLSKMSKCGYNIGSLADETELSRDTISNVLSGRTAPSYLTMNAIFYALKLSTDEGMAIFFPNYYRHTKVGERMMEVE